MKRKELLKEVDQIINNDREKQYGTPEDNFELIAHYWSVYLNRPIGPTDVGVMQALLKVARIQSGRVKADNFIDLAGYALCAGEIATERQKEIELLKEVDQIINNDGVQGQQGCSGGCHDNVSK